MPNRNITEIIPNVNELNGPIKYQEIARIDKRFIYETYF